MRGAADRPVRARHTRGAPGERAAGEKIRCPLLVLWGAEGKIGRWYEPMAIWRQYCAAEVTGGPVNSGHYLAEEAPAEVLERFEAFF
jgi:haloacetate dehalogenase